MGTNDRVLIFAPVTSKAVPSVLASSVCWSLQCLISALTQRGRWGTLFLSSLVQSRCGEGGMLQTNNTGMCSQCFSHARPAPTHGAHRSGSRLLRREQSEAGPGLHAPPRSKPLRLRHSGSPQRRRLGWACVLCPSQARVAQCVASAVAATYRLSLVLGFLGVLLAPLVRQMVTVQNPKKSQLAKKPACRLVGKVSPGLRLPPSSPYGSGCLSPDGDGLQLALFCTWSWWCLMLELFTW